jgi:hypothetical protein
MSKALLGAAAEFLPTVATGASNTYYCDYYYTDIPGSGTALRMLIVGGYACDGASAGFAYSLTNSAPSLASSYIGSRLRFEAA